MKVKRTAEGKLPTRTGMWSIYSYREIKNPTEEHVVIFKGNLNSSLPILTRMHSSCLTAETFHATNCDCHEQMEEAMRMIAEARRGVIVWLHQEGRGNGLAAKVAQLGVMIKNGTDTVEAFESLGMKGECRDYSVAMEIYKDLNIKGKLLVMTHNPDKLQAFRDAGFEAEMTDFKVHIPSAIAKKDIEAKKNKLGHIYKEAK